MHFIYLLLSLLIPAPCVKAMDQLIIEPSTCPEGRGRRIKDDYGLHIYAIKLFGATEYNFIRMMVDITPVPMELKYFNHTKTFFYNFTLTPSNFYKNEMSIKVQDVLDRENKGELQNIVKFGLILYTKKTTCNIDTAPFYEISEAHRQMTKGCMRARLPSERPEFFGEPINIGKITVSIGVLNSNFYAYQVVAQPGDCSNPKNWIAQNGIFVTTADGEWKSMYYDIGDETGVYYN